MAGRWEGAEWTAVAVAGISLASGGAQALFPDALLARLSATTPSAETSLLFAALGVFTVLFGALLLHALLRPTARAVVVPWVALQKSAGAALVVIGIRGDVLLSAAGWGGALDGAAALFLFWWWRRGPGGGTAGRGGDP